MFPKIVDYTTSLVKVLNEYADSNKPFKAKEIIERFAMDAIGSSAFGIELNTLQYQSDDLQQAVKKTTNLEWRKLVSYAVNWKLLRFLRFRTCRYHAMDYFRNMVKHVKEYRKNNNIFRKDLFQFLLQLENNGESIETDLRLMKHHSLTMNQITTQCFSFFVGGFETSSSLISIAMLEIALSPDIQCRLRDNIKESLEKYGTFSYEAVKDMYYLEWVINGKF